MGCGLAREQLENKMMAYKLQRMEVQVEKEKELKKLAEIEGHTVERHQIPDYIDPDFARERQLHEKENDKDKDKKKKDKDSKTDCEASSQKKKKKKKN